MWAYQVPFGDDFHQARWVGQGSGEGRKDREPVRGAVEETKGLQKFHPVNGDQFIVLKKRRKYDISYIASEDWGQHCKAGCRR